MFGDSVLMMVLGLTLLALMALLVMVGNLKCVDEFAFNSNAILSRTLNEVITGIGAGICRAGTGFILGK